MANNINIFGIHAVFAVCAKYPELVLQLLVSKDLDDPKVSPLYSASKTHDIPLRQASRKELDNLSKGSLHQGVIAICKSLPQADKQLLKKLLAEVEKPFLLLLDGVQDPHNLGACMRTANAMGVDAVIVPKHDCCGLTPVVHKVSCGASLITPLIAVNNLARAMDEIAKAGVWIVGLDVRADQEIQEMDLKQACAVVMGAEGSGMRRLTREKCDFLAKLPMCGDMESLNVSVATGITLYEVLRQNR